MELNVNQAKISTLTLYPLLTLSKDKTVNLIFQTLSNRNHLIVLFKKSLIK